MERDFMGLNSKEPMATVKREITDEAPAAQWPYLKNAFSHPNFMSFRSGPAGASQDDGMKRMNSHLQLSNPLMKPNFSSYGQNVTSATMNQQLLGIPMTVTSSVGPVVGFTDPWNHKKPSSAPAQMTIFYAGNVSVYDGLTPEQAQAIMLLAGNGTCLTPNMSISRSPMLSPAMRASPTVTDPLVSNQPLNSQPNPGVTNQSSLSPHPNAQSGSVTACKEEQAVTKTAGISSAPIIRPEPQRVVPSRGTIPMSSMKPTAVPQFRKASLARFLEKRKERVASVAPYNCEKKPQHAPGHNNLVGSATTSAANSMTSP